MTTSKGARRLAAGLSFLGFLALFLPRSAALPQGPQDQAGNRLKETLNDLDPVGGWFYDDLQAAYAEARKTDRPMMVVFR